MKSTLLALLLYSIISVSNSEEIFISDSNFISKIDDTKNKNYNDVFSQHNFIYEGSLIKHDSSENGLGRYYRYWSDDKYNHTACPFPEYYKWIDERWIRRSLNFDDEFEIAGFCLIFILIIFATTNKLKIMIWVKISTF